MQRVDLFVRCYRRKALTILAWVSHSLLPSPTINNHCEFLLVENFLADSDAESNGHKDTVNKDEKKDNAKGLSVAFDPATGPPEEAPQGKVQLVLLNYLYMG